MTRKYTSFGYVDKATGTIQHYGIVLKSDVPTTGVVGMNALSEWIYEEISAGIDLAWEDHLAECKGECSDCDCTHEMDECSCKEKDRPGVSEDHEHEPCDQHDHCGPQESGDMLMGQWIKDSDSKWTEDKSSEYAAIYRSNSNVIQVTWSKHTKRCAPCSPCYPGQGDLDNEGTMLCFDLPPELYAKDE